MALKITITDAGRAELINADNTGTGPVEITHIAFTEAAFTPSKKQAALPDEIKRFSSIAGEVVADDTISVTAKDEGTDAYTVHGFGLISEYGTLFAVYSQEAPIIEKSGPTTLLLTVDIILADLPAASLTFGDISFSNPPASTTTPGVVRLSNATDSTAQNLAATPRAVKLANDNANSRLSKVANLADLTNPAKARVNLGLGSSATLGTTALRTSSSTTLLLQAAAMNDHRQSGDHDDRYVKRNGDNMSGDLTLSKSNPWLTLNSITSGGTGTDQGAGVSIGESGYKGGAALHLTYTGDGKGHIGMGTVDPETGIPEFSAMELHYRGREVAFKGALQLPGATTLEGATNGLKISNAGNGSVDIGNRNTGYTHYQSTAGKHYFYGEVHAQGKFVGDGSGLTGTASLRARGTTKGDVGLSKVPNLEATDQAEANTLMTRDNSGDTWARLFRSTYAGTNETIAAIYTSRQIGGDFMRPSTPAQVMAALGAIAAERGRASNLRLSAYTYLNDYDEPFSSDHGLRFYVRDGVIEISATGGETGHPEIDLAGDRVYHQENIAGAFNLLGLGVNQTWRDLTNSRNGGVTYTNTTGKPIALSAWAVSNKTMNLVVGGVTIGRARTDANNSGAAIDGTVFAIIPHGTTYSLSIKPDMWAELR